MSIFSILNELVNKINNELGNVMDFFPRQDLSLIMDEKERYLAIDEYECQLATFFPDWFAT